MVRICFVTQELAPFCPGGVGVLLHNLIKENQNPSVDIHILTLDNLNIEEASFRYIFPNATLWKLTDLIPKESLPTISPPRRAFSTHPWHFTSYQISRALLELRSRGVIFDVVEFPDWGGLAFCTCQERLLGHFDETLIAVRIHSTDSILRSGEPVFGGEAAANLSDLERKSLRDADIIVGHISAVVEATRAHFGFSSDWMSKVRINLPPIPLTPASSSIEFAPETAICFPSKIQSLKRPDVFLNGALYFMRANPDYKGPVIFAARPADEKLKSYLSGRIPADLAHRVSFLSNSPESVRTSIIENAISIFPSPFESFCLAAYEASLRGGWVALNSANPAFSDDSLWRDDVNCLKFDGTSIGLAKRLGLAWSNRAATKLSPILHTAEREPYWTQLPPKNTATPHTAENSRPLVSIVIPFYNMGRYINRTLESALSSSYSNLEVILVDDCSTDAQSQITLEKIRGVKHLGCVRIVSAPANVGLSSARNLGIQAAEGEFILTLDSDDLIRSDFIETAVSALLRRPDYSLVVPQTAMVSDTASNTEISVVDYAIFTGEAIRAGTVANRFSTATCLAKREIFLEFPYDEFLSSYEDWDFYSRITNSGKRFIVTNDIFFYYRRRIGSMITENTRERHIRNLSIIRSKQSFFLGDAALDLNIMTDTESGYHAELKALVSVGTTRLNLGMDVKEQYIRILTARLARQETLLKEATAKLTAVKELIGEGCTQKNLNTSQADSKPLTKLPGKNFMAGLIERIIRSAQNKKLARDVVRSGELDSGWYLENNPDVAAAGIDPALHYVLHGRREGRLPRPG